MKLTGYTIIPLMAAVLLSVSCKKDGYTPGGEQNYSGVNVYFDETAMDPSYPYFSMPLSASELTFTLERDDAPRQDENVPIHWSCAYPEAFDIPESVFFAQGVMSAEVTVYFTGEMEDFKEYRLALYVDEAYTQQYIEQTTYPRIDVTIVREDYELYQTGIYTCGGVMMDLIDWGIDAGGSDIVSRTVGLEYSETLDAYRIDPWGHGNYIRFSITDEKNEAGLNILSLDAQTYLTGDVYLAPGDSGNETEEVNITARLAGDATYNMNRREFTFPFTYGYPGQDSGTNNDTFGW